MSAEPTKFSSADTGSGSSANNGKRWRRFWFRVAAVLLGLSPFLLLEAGLRLFDVADPAAARDPLAGFSSQRALFERVGDVYRTARSREPYFGRQEFKVTKLTNGFRAFCFGGSTVYGHPYLNDTAFTKWLELELAGGNSSRAVEVINCGGVSYASYRLAPIVRETLRYQPDLIVLAMGHNEFLEDRTYQPIKSRSAARRWIEEEALSLRTVTLALELSRKLRGNPSNTSAAGNSSQLAPEVRPRLDDSRTGYASYHRDDAWRRQVVGQFEDSLRAMIADCRAARVPVLIVTLGSSLRDCPPFKSEHRAGITASEETRWQAAFDAATAAERSDLNAALRLYRGAEAIDGQHALLCFRIARCLDRLGQPAQAREYFLRAMDQDVCPLRMLDEMYRLQLRVATEEKVPVVDARQMLEALCPDGLPGSELYLDHVHPTLGAHQRIAQAIAAKVQELRLLPGAQPWTAEARVAAYRKHFRMLDANYFTNGRRRVEWLETWARRERLHEETLPRDARGCFRQGCRLLDVGEEEQAWESFRRALQMDPGIAKALTERAVELDQQGRPEPALWLVKRLNNHAPNLETNGAPTTSTASSNESSARSKSQGQ
ncbi:MAG: hypothetical protein HY300_19605 [Verrucomicrobia bacterium]|nr:hypothetical protein [Verrucomicrobiota bacterium]